MDKLSADRKKYLRKIRLNKIAVFTTQILLVVGFIVLWEVFANIGWIDSFIASQPSRILKTFMNLSRKQFIRTFRSNLFRNYNRFCFTEQYLE